jgi:hypothetical protein
MTQPNQPQQFTGDQLHQLERIVASAIAPVNLQLQTGEKRMDTLTSGITDLREKLEKNNESTEEIREAFDFAKKGLVFMGAIGNGMKWVAGIVVAILGLYAVWRK